MITITRKRFLLIALTAFVAAFVVSAGVLRSRKQQSEAQKIKDWLSTATVDSKVKDLEIINLRILRPDTKVPGVAFEIKNSSSRKVMAYEVACGDDAISQDGLVDEQKPTVIIEPWGTYTVEMAEELSSGKPLVITAAIFDDEKEEGEKVALRRMHSIRAHQKAKGEPLNGKIPEGGSNQ